MKQDSLLIQFFKMELYRNLTSNPTIIPDYYSAIVESAVQDVLNVQEETKNNCPNGLIIRR